MDSWSFVPGVKNFVADENGMMLMRNQEFEGSGSSIRDVFLSGNRFGIGEEESRSCNKPSSSSNLGSNCRDSSSLIDLKLGRFLDHKDGQSKANLPAKKARNGGLSSQRPYCQVHGCRKDLSSSKDYHKRHKVCEIHSKTTRVIVNGVEQRFCQQCSRFHLLAEFDDGKRSCRKRLAGHNERRRKPHIGIHTGRSGRVFHSYNGTGLERSSSVLSSFVCQDILPGSVLHSQKYEMQDWQKALKVEDGCEYGAIPSSKGLQRHDLRYANASSSSLSSEKQYNPPLMHNPGFHSSHSHPMFLSCGSDQEFTLLDSSTTSSYGCALSLLSSQSQNSSIHSSGLSMITPGCNSHYNIGQVCEKLTRISPQNSTSTGMSNSGASFIEPILISGGSDSVSYGFNRMSIPGAEFMNDAKNRVSCEDGCSTIDLLQLSSQLQRVEHERQQSMKVKEDNNAFFGLRIT